MANQFGGVVSEISGDYVEISIRGNAVIDKLFEVESNVTELEGSCTNQRFPLTQPCRRVQDHVDARPGGLASSTKSRLPCEILVTIRFRDKCKAYLFL
ncbi:MAG: hypothetical protein MI921_26975 [Cytophagales bacterium]|nr:hypothetical protein [Cytophagales bacterium]